MNLIRIAFLFCSFNIVAQITPFVDYNRYFKTLYNGNFRQLEMQAIRSFEASDHFIVYLDYRGDFRMYDGEKLETLTNQNITYKLSDGQLAWAVGTGLFCLNNGKKEMLTVFGNRYEIADSLIVYEDTRFNTLNCRYLGENIQLVQSTGELAFPLKIGDNTVVFKDNGDLIKFFWRGKSTELYVYTKDISFSCGMDVICFNDPLNQTFAVFDKGQILDVESMPVNKSKAARGFIVYEDRQGNLWRYQDGEKAQLSNFTANFWEAKDDLVIWEENSYIYTWYKGEKFKIANYIPADYKMKNGTFVFRNSLGGVSIYQNGKVEELTKQTQASYNIYDNNVVVELFNKSFVIRCEGKNYEY